MTRKQDTLIVTLGRDPEANFGIVNPPVYHCSTVIFPTVETLLETRRDRASGGAGLGLSIARRAVELHKGTIRARNAQPGLLVEIDLPIVGGNLV